MPPCPGPGMEVLAVPALLVHVMQAEQLDPPALQVLAQDLGAVHVPIGPLGAGAEARGEDEDAGAGVAHHLERHLATEGRRMPLDSFDAHVARTRNGRAFRKRRPQSASRCAPLLSST